MPEPQTRALIISRVNEASNVGDTGEILAHGVGRGRPRP